VYVQANWPRPSGAAAETDTPTQTTWRLLRSVEGLTDKLALPWPAVPARADLEQAGFTGREIERLQRARAATTADYFNEGVPLARLRAEGISLPPLDEQQ
jgi:hypothetical protein